MADALPRIFLDTSAAFAAIWSATGGARELFVLGEGGFIQLLLGGDVVRELEAVIRAKVPAKMESVARLLDAARVEIVAGPQPQALEAVRLHVAYEPDARVMASALRAHAAYFVTHDKQHFLKNKPLRATLPFVVGTPGDCLACCRGWMTKPIQANMRGR